jgi:hypothetical protein
MVLAVRRGAIMAGSLCVAMAFAGSPWAEPRPAAAAGPTNTVRVGPPATAAPDRATERRWRAACTHDAFDFCTFQALSGNRAGVRNCLERNIERISEPCRQIIRAGRGKASPVPPAQPQP